MSCNCYVAARTSLPEYLMGFSSMLFIALAAIASIGRASGEDNLKLAVGQRGNWATSVAEVGQRAGIFKQHGLLLELLYTQGSGETQQAVIAESVDIGRDDGRHERLRQGSARSHSRGRDH